MSNTDLKSRAIFVTRHGSHAYGLNTATSDLDIKGVLIGEHQHYLGFLGTVEQIEEREPNDLVIYEMRKFFKLASDCNPNIIEVLHTDDSDVLYMNGFGHDLRVLKDEFLSQKAKHTFSGYAMAQLKRMKNHHEWMKNPPMPPESRTDLGLPENKNWCDHIDKFLTEHGRNSLIDNFPAGAVVNYVVEMEWREASRKWVHYKEWLAGRNPARHELEARFGYDTKHGMHLVRLMRMGHEILTTGKVVVKRPDREELLAIRNEGIWSYEKIIAYAEEMDAKLTEIYKAGTSPLPKEPDRKLLNTLCEEMISRALFNDKYEDWGKAWDGVVTLPQS